MTRRLVQYNAELAARRPDVWARSKWICEAPLFAVDVAGSDADLMALANDMINGCRLRATHVHHRKYRQRGGTNSLNNLLHVCEPCHSWIHAHGGFDQPANRLRLALSAGESEER